jgi:hypothetical protein
MGNAERWSYSAAGLRATAPVHGRPRAAICPVTVARATIDAASIAIGQSRARIPRPMRRSVDQRDNIRLPEGLSALLRV